MAESTDSIGHPHSEASLRRRWLGQLALTAGFLALLAWRLDVGEALGLMAGADLGWFAAALGLAVLDRVWMIGKWLPLLAVQAPEIGRWRAARSYLAAGFTNYFLPATLGSDALRAASLGRPHGAVAEVGASIAAERMLGAAATALLVLLALHLGLPEVVPLPGLSWLTLLAALGGVVAFLVPFHPRVQSWLGRHGSNRLARLAKRFADALLVYRKEGVLLGIVMALTVAEVFLPIGILWMLCFSLGVEVSLTALLVAVPISMLIAKLPISIAGIGPQEASFVTLLSAYGVEPEAALALAIPNRLIDIAIAVPGAWALPELWRDLRRRPEAPEALGARVRPSEAS